MNRTEPPPAAAATVPSGPRAWRLLPVAVAAAVWCLLLAVATVPGAEEGARARLSWMLPPLFHDWQVVHQGWQLARAGGDPLGAPDVPFNYPRIVLLGAWLGGVEIPVKAAGLTTAAALLAAVTWRLRPRSRGEALLAAALVASPPVLLVIERGNLDAWALVFVILGIAGLSRPKPRPVLAAVGAATLTAAAWVKLFPAAVLAGAAGYWRGGRRWLAVGGLAAFGLWAAVSLDEVALVLRKTTRGFEPAYGRMVAGGRLQAELRAGRNLGGAGEQGVSGLLQASLAVCLAWYVVAVVLGWRARARVRAAALPDHDGAGAALVGGALVYAGTFLLGTNWSYRLVFLLLCVPALWRARDRPGLRSWAEVLLAGIAVLLLAPLQLSLGWFLAREGIAWALAGGLLASAVALIAARGGEGENAIGAPIDPE